MILDIIGAALVFAGLFVILTGVLGAYRFHYVLNRMHAAALIDTLGLLLVTAGLIVILGVGAHALKLLVILVFMWLASPVMSHLIARTEMMTYPHLEEECEVIPDADRDL